MPDKVSRELYVKIPRALCLHAFWAQINPWTRIENSFIRFKKNGNPKTGKDSKSTTK
ncbi:MAG: hypothetical protein ACLKAK_03740 [Alkaliphilus sp.]